MHTSPSTGVVVTGGASGIGRATAAALLAAGRPVAIWDLDDGRVVAARHALAAGAPGVAVVGLAVDVTDVDAVAAALEASRGGLGTIGGVVHAAGNIIAERIDDVDWQHWSRQLDVHLHAYARLVQSLLPDLRANQGSAIVAVSSIMALLGDPQNPAYCAAKAGVLGLNRSLTARLGPMGIRVNAICPGYIDTPMLAPVLEREQVHASLISSASLRRLGRPEEIGAVARFLLSDDASFVTGQAIAVDGGVTTTV